jgi:hypothetical protein
VIRDKVLRIASIGLVLYGLFGFALVALGYSISSQTLGELEAVRSSLSEQRSSLVGTLRATSATLGSTASGFDNVNRTLGDARDSSQQAAELARGMSQTMTDLASASNVQVMGFSPFGQLGQGFGQASQQMQQLGADLDRTSQSLGQNTGDLTTIKANLGDVRSQVDALARAFEVTPLPGGPAGSLQPFRLAIYGLLIWLAGQALVSVLIGAALFERSHRRIRAHYERSRTALPPPSPVLESGGNDRTKADAA